MIKLSKLTDYAVVVLAELARAPGQLVNAASLAEKTGLPEPTVAKILKLLAKSELIESVRGINGGYTLSRAPEEVSVAAVVAALEGPIALAACVSGSQECCARSSTCAVKGKWDPVNVAMKQALENVSLAQMMTR